MSKMRDALRADVAKRFGEGAAKAIDYLFENEVLDDSLARKHVTKVKVFEDLMATKLSEKQIHSNVGQDVGLDESRVYRMCTGGR